MDPYLPVKAYVMVGNSRRLPKKHLIEILPGKRLIDLVVENLKAMGFEVIIYSKFRFDADAEILIDTERWILPSLISIFSYDARFFLFGGDMPFIHPRAVNILRVYEKTVVPRWNATGYLEPLHALYTDDSLPCLENELHSEKGSLTHALLHCPVVHFVPAESMPSTTFFNVNTLHDLEKLKAMLQKIK